MLVGILRCVQCQNDRRKLAMTAFIMISSNRQKDGGSACLKLTSLWKEWVLGAHRAPICGWCHLGRIAGRLLPLWAIPFTFLLSRVVWQRPCVVRTEARLVARMAHLVSGHPDSLGSGWLSRDLLLLSRRVLQGLLGRSSFLHRR